MSLKSSVGRDRGGQFESSRRVESQPSEGQLAAKGLVVAPVVVVVIVWARRRSPTCCPFPSIARRAASKMAAAARTPKYMYKTAPGNPGELSIEYGTDLGALTRLEVS